MTALLAAEGVSVRFGAVEAVRDVSLEMEPGSAVGVIGPNGAGKTSLVDALSGLVPLSGGRISFAGVEVHRLPAHRRAALGLSRTFQSLQLFEDLTVAENLCVAAEAGRRVDPSDVRRRVHEAAETAGVVDLMDRLPSTLRPGQRRLVGLARALAGQPKALLLDEPAAGLDPDERDALARTCRALVDQGVALLVVDHDLELVLDLCETVWVLDLGEVIAHGPPAAIRADARVAKAYMGETTDALAIPPEPAPTRTGQPVLEARGLTTGYGGTAVVTDLNLAVRQGEVLTLLGPNGAGKTTTLRALHGSLPALAGEMRFLGELVSGTAHRMARRGMGYVPDHRAVLPGLTVAENLRLATREPIDAVLDQAPFAVLRPLLNRRAGLLSGGEQHLLALARALSCRPRALLVDELSLGLAPRTAREALEALRRAATEDGVAVVLVEQQSQQALAVADTACVLRQGRIVLEGTATDLRADPERVRAAYLGPAPDTARTEKHGPAP